MEALLLLIIINAVVLIFAFKTKIGLYTLSPEQQWKKELNEFDNTIKAIERLEQESDFKIGPDHIYK
jgi:hypothetical protein